MTECAGEGDGRAETAPTAAGPAIEEGPVRWSPRMKVETAARSSRTNVNDGAERDSPRPRIRDQACPRCSRRRRRSRPPGRGDLAEGDRVGNPSRSSSDSVSTASDRISGMMTNPPPYDRPDLEGDPGDRQQDPALSAPTASIGVAATPGIAPPWRRPSSCNASSITPQPSSTSTSLWAQRGGRGGPGDQVAQPARAVLAALPACPVRLVPAWMATAGTAAPAPAPRPAPTTAATRPGTARPGPR